MQTYLGKKVKKTGCWKSKSEKYFLKKMNIIQYLVSLQIPTGNLEFLSVQMTSADKIKRLIPKEKNTPREGNHFC